MSPAPRTPTRKTTHSRKTPATAPRHKPVAFESFAETTSAAILISQGSRIFYVNSAATWSTGYSHEELLEMEVWQLAHPNYQPAFKQMEETRAWVDHVPSRFEIKIVTKGGEERWWDVTAGDIAYQGKSAIAITAFDITERDVAERALRTAHTELEARVQQRTTELAAVNEKLQSVLSTITEAYVAFDADWRFLAVNPLAERGVFGRPAKELIGKVIWDEYPQTIGQEVYQQYHRAIETRQPVHFESPSRIVPGRWFEVHAYPRDGELEAYFHDITDRKRAEEEIASVSRFPSENPNPVHRLNQAGEVLYANEASRTLLQAWARTTGDIALSKWCNLAAEALASQIHKTVDIECTGRAYSFSVVPIIEAGYVNFYGRDITARKRVEEALRESEQKYSQLFDKAAIPAALTKLPENVFADVNEAFEKLFGYTRQEVVGKTSLELGITRPEEHAVTRAEIGQRGLQHDADKHVLTKSGEERIVSLNVSALELGGQRYALSTVQDITERKRAEDALRESEERYRLLFDNSLDGILLTTPDGGIQAANAAACRMFGRTEQEICQIGRNGIVDVSDPRVAAAVEERARTGKFHSEMFLMRGDGARFLGEVSSTIYKGKDGRLRTSMIVRDITARKQAEEALRESERKLRTLFELLPVGISILNTQRQIVSANPALERILDVTAERLRTGADQTQQYLQSDRSPLPATEFASARALAEQRAIHQLETGIVKEDGSVIWTLVDAVPVSFSDWSVVIVTSDITQHKQAELALRESEEKYRRLIENIDDLVCEVDAQARYQFVNSKYEHVLGYAPAELLGHYVRELIHPDDLQLSTPSFKQLVDGGSVSRNEWRFRHKTGEWRWFDCIAQTYEKSPGEQHVVVISRDVTERKKMEEALRQARDELEVRVQARTEELEAINQELRKEIEERKQIEKQLQLQMTAVRAAANGIVLTDRQGHIQWCNPAFTHMTGYSAEEVVGQTMRILRSGKQAAEFYERLWATILAGEVWRGELTNRHKDGRLYIEEQTIAPVLNEQREITHFVAVKQDITERKQAEDRLERYNQDLLALSKAERAQRQLAETLTAANQALTQSLSLETVLETLLEYVARLVPYDSANVMLLEAESRLVVRVARGYERWTNAELVRAITFDAQTTPVLNTLLTTRSSALVPDTRLEPNWQSPPGVEHVRSWLGVPLMAGGNVIGLYSLDKTEPGFFTPEHVRMAEMLVGQAAVAIQNAWLFEQVRAGRERLQSLSRRLVEVQEAERLYVARELHDEAGQALTSLLFKLGQLEPQTTDPRQADQLAELKQMTNGVLESLHRLAMDLRPASLDHLGLVPALLQYVKAIGDRFGIIAQFKAVGIENERLSADVETALYRIVQEALTNIVRHAHAARADVLLERRGDRVIVVIEDDGLGFDTEAARFAQQGHLGLAGMQERAEMLGGSLVIESAVGTGTTVVVEVPYDHSHFDR